MPVLKQATIRDAQTISGSTLHTGNDVTLTIKPGAPNTGFIFKRIDLSDEPTIAAHIDNVKQVERATTLGEGGVKVHTVEHLLSALRGFRIDNAVIELNANEPPIGDGSGTIYVEALEKAGRVEQEPSVLTYHVREPIYIAGKDGAFISAWPSDDFEVQCTNANHTGKHTQYLHWNLDKGDYTKEISKARTFVFYEEVEPLMEKGLIKGGSLENAIVIRGDAILSREPLRYEDEFVRHKILDIVGDLTLFPARLKARIVTAKPGHALNVELARAIFKQYKHYVSQQMPVENIPVSDSGLDINEVMKILPHRYPFLLVDRILRFEGDLKAIGQKAVTINEPFFQGHFPGHPIMPGVLQVEAMAQVASILMLKQSGQGGRIGYFMSADKVKFRKPVLPGDTLIIQVELTKARGKIGRAYGQCLVKNEVVSEGDLTFAMMDT